MKDVFLKQFTKKCEFILKDNLICLLLIGSAKNRDNSPFSDIDLVAIVKRVDFEKMKEVRQLVRLTDHLLDLSFLSWDEISKDPNKFRLGSHGCYHLELVLKSSKVLYGKNILKEIKSPSMKNLKLSIFEKIAEYTWWTRRMFIESNRRRSIEDNYKLNTRLIKMIRDLLFLFGFSNISDAPKEKIIELIKSYPDLMTYKEIEILNSLADLNLAGNNAVNMSDEYFEDRFVIVNKIYKLAVEIFENNK